MTTERWIVGAEHDEDLLAALRTSLRALGYGEGPKSWGIGGSQEISSWTAARSDGQLVIEAETYVGLSITSPSVLVQAVKDHFLRSRRDPPDGG
jgi:hypothetical protein